ncbi:MAG: hypothetical protein LBU74_04785 [Methanobacteriaceae archaeon]|jgi:hypothetical protein|nr:hypothetical protein [Candidatus Methanorudis spinitermitis]
MDKKILAIIIVVVAILAIVTSVLVLDVFTPKADFENKFMTGTLYGLYYIEENATNTTGWEDAYIDSTNNITYDFLAIKNSTFLIDMLKHFGMKKISSENYNGQNWDIYFLNFNDMPDLFKSYDSGYLLVTTKNDVDYIVMVSSFKVTSDTSLDSELFTSYINPLMKTITLKNAYNAPEIYKFMDISKEEFNTMVKYIDANGWDILNKI